MEIDMLMSEDFDAYVRKCNNFSSDVEMVKSSLTVPSRFTTKQSFSFFVADPYQDCTYFARTIRDIILSKKNLYFMVQEVPMHLRGIVEIGEIMEFSYEENIKLDIDSPNFTGILTSHSGRKFRMKSPFSIFSSSFAEEIHSDNLLLLMNYEGPASEDKTKENLLLFDMFDEPLEINDVVIVNGNILRPAIINSYDVMNLYFRLVRFDENICSDREQSLWHEREYVFTDNDGKRCYKTQGMIKAPDHVRLRVLHWKLIS